jgi:hypothetical protein
VVPNSQKIVFAVTMISVFVVSFGIMWRQRAAMESQVTVTAPAAPADGTPSVGSSSPAPRHSFAESPRLIAAPARAANSRAPAIETPPSNDDGPELPVALSIVNKDVYIRNESTDFVAVRRNVNEAIVSNSGDKPLVITAIETYIPTQEASQTQFSLAKGGQKHFGVEDGLNMLAGDQLTLRSPSFRELSQQIP